MSRKPKEAVAWLRLKYEDTELGRMRLAQTVGKLARQSGTIELRKYSEEAVVEMVKTAIIRAQGRMVYTPRDLEAARNSGAQVSVTQTNTEELATVEIAWPKSHGFLIDREEAHADHD